MIPVNYFLEFAFWSTSLKGVLSHLWPPLNRRSMVITCKHETIKQIHLLCHFIFNWNIYENKIIYVLQSVLQALKNPFPYSEIVCLASAVLHILSDNSSKRKNIFFLCSWLVWKRYIKHSKNCFCTFNVLQWWDMVIL